MNRTVTEAMAGGQSPAGEAGQKSAAFSVELRGLAARFDDRPTRLSELLQATGGRGFELVLLCIALPFITPIPLSGLSMPFGLVAAVIGARLALGRKPWLPQRLLERELPARFLTRLLQGASRIMRVLEVLLRPRLIFLHESFVFRRVAGALILMCGLLLVLPLPFSNSLPAGTIVLLAAGHWSTTG